MTLREAYLNVGKQLMEQRENDFIAEVDAIVYMEGDRKEGDPIFEIENRKLRIAYNIDIEYRSYGIKEMSAINFRILPFSIENLNLEEPEVVMNKHGIMDATGIQVERDMEGNEYGSFYPKSVELHMDTDGNILMENSIIKF